MKLVLREIRETIRATLVVGLGVGFLMGALNLRSEIPRKLSYQGYLSENGRPMPDGAYEMTFGLWDSLEGGNRLWEETHEVNSRDGVVIAILGERSPLDLPFDRPYWLEVNLECHGRNETGGELPE